MGNESQEPNACLFSSSPLFWISSLHFHPPGVYPKGNMCVATMEEHAFPGIGNRKEQKLFIQTKISQIRDLQVAGLFCLKRHSG